MSKISLEDAKRALLREATMVVMTEGSLTETIWLNAAGDQIAHSLGLPALCQNSPTRTKPGCMHFSFYWRLGEPGWFIGNIEEKKLDVELETWINQQRLFAHRCMSTGRDGTTTGTWNTAKERWFWGPKVQLPH